MSGRSSLFVLWALVEVSRWYPDTCRFIVMVFQNAPSSVSPETYVSDQSATIPRAWEIIGFNELDTPRARSKGTKETGSPALSMESEAKPRMTRMVSSSSNDMDAPKFCGEAW
jgi:hypothetical protein